MLEGFVFLLPRITNSQKLFVSAYAVIFFFLRSFPFRCRQHSAVRGQGKPVSSRLLCVQMQCCCSRRSVQEMQMSF